MSDASPPTFPDDERSVPDGGPRDPASGQAPGGKRRRATAFHEAAHAVIGTALGDKTTSVSIIRDGDTLGTARQEWAHRKHNEEGGARLVDDIGQVLLEPRIHAIAEDLEGPTGEDEEPFPAALARLDTFFSNRHRVRALRQKVDELKYESSIVSTMAGAAAVCVLEGRAEPDWEGGARSDRNGIDTSLAMLRHLDWYPAYVDDEMYSVYESDEYERALWVRTLVMVRGRWHQIEAVAEALLEHDELDGDRVRALIQEADAKRRGLTGLPTEKGT